MSCGRPWSWLWQSLRYFEDCFESIQSCIHSFSRFFSVGRRVKRKEMLWHIVLRNVRLFIQVWRMFVSKRNEKDSREKSSKFKKKDEKKSRQKELIARARNTWSIAILALCAASRVILVLALRFLCSSTLLYALLAQSFRLAGRFHYFSLLASLCNRHGWCYGSYYPLVIPLKKCEHVFRDDFHIPLHLRPIIWKWSSL